MIVTVEQLKEKYNNYSNVLTKINREVKKGILYPLVKGIYETNPNIEGIKLAQFIYGPSYISFDYALSYYGLIPETAYNYTCATYNKRKTKIYTNYFGTYIYCDVPKRVFSLGIEIKNDGDYSYQIATPEKALCDKLYITKPVKNMNELKMLLFQNLRIDEFEFNKLNKKELIELSLLYNSTNLNFLAKYIIGGKENENGIKSNVSKI